MQQSYGTTWFGPAYQPSGLHKIASYDLDGTLIKTKSGKIFPIDLNDWKLIGTATEHLKAKATDGYTVVVITNQKKKKF